MDSKIRLLGLTFWSAVTAIVLSGCGQSATSKSPNLSDSTVYPSTTEAKSVASCSKSSANSKLEFRVMTVQDSTGSVDKNRVRIKITRMPAEFKTQNLELVIFKWYSIPAGQAEGNPTLNPNKLKFQFERRSGNGFANLVNKDQEGTFEYINFKGYEMDGKTYAGVSHVGAHAGISTSSAGTFFNAANLNVDLEDAAGEYKAIRVVLYKDSAVFAQSDALIPAFYADPNHYKSVRDIGLLVDLHPFRSSLGATMSDAQWMSYANQNCF